MNKMHTGFMIHSSSEGALVVAACIIMQAVEDVRIYLETPNLTTGRKTKHSLDSGKTAEARRRTLAAQAAAWLDSDDCRHLCQILEGCGHRVPMARLKRELADLKRKAVIRG